MLTHPIIDKLHQLKCLGMATALTEQLQSTACDALSFEERLGLLVDRETTVRDDRRMTNRLRRANPFDLGHQSAPAREMARPVRRPHVRRCHPRPPRPQRLQAQVERRIDAKEESLIDPSRSLNGIIEPPRRFAPTGDRLDRTR